CRTMSAWPGAACALRLSVCPKWHGGSTPANHVSPLRAGRPHRPVGRFEIASQHLRRERFRGWLRTGHESAAKGVDGQLEAVAHPELVENRRQVIADGRLADRQAFGDVLVFQTLRDQG